VCYSLFAALCQNRASKNIFGRSSFFAPKAQKKMNVQKIISVYDFDAKRQTVSVESNLKSKQRSICIPDTKWNHQ
jgi:hypothetical protein